MDIIAISETSGKEDFGFLPNVEIEGYGNYHTASSRGGGAIYVNKGFNSMERFDLKINNVEFESSLIEIINKNIVKILLLAAYTDNITIHNNFIEFFQYLEGCLGRLAKENKEFYICGDFNFDLVKIDTDNFIENDFNLLCWYDFLPRILHPTRLTANSATW